MSISAIQNSGVYQSPEVQRTQPAPAALPAEEAPSKGERIVPEDRAFDRYDPEDKSDTETCSTDRVDREIKQLKRRKKQLEQQLRSASPEQAETIQRQLDQVSRELARKDDDTYRRQHAVFS